MMNNERFNCAETLTKAMALEKNMLEHFVVLVISNNHVLKMSSCWKIDQDDQ